MNVQSIVGSKGAEVATIAQTASLHEAVKQLGERRIGALVVSGDGRKIEGIISERDIVRAVAAAGGDPLAASVGSHMSIDVITCSVGDGVDRLMELMTERRIRHLPVVDENGHLAGIISIGDLVKFRMDKVEAEAAAMLSYIQSV